MSKKTVFKNARLVDPATETDGIGHLIIENDKILSFEKNCTSESFSDEIEVIDCCGYVLCPGIVDIAVSVGEPGAEHKESLFTATRAAAAGGITTIVTMPDTKPIIDDVALVEFVIRRANDEGLVNVLPMASLTQNLEGLRMTEIGLLSEAGAVAFTDGYRSVSDASVMRRALAYASNFDALIAHHTEVPELSNCGVMTEGEVSTRLGLAGAPSASETIMVERDIRLLKSLDKGRYHAASISTEDSVGAIRQAKTETSGISAAVAPYHFTLNESEVLEYRTFAKVSPPLRSEKDRLAVVEGIKDGTIEIIASHHRPEPQEKKRIPFSHAEYGAVGLETLLSASLSLYHNGNMTLPEVLHRLTAGPANLLKLPSGKLETGAPADLLLFDPDEPWLVNSDTFLSKSKNSPFDGKPLQGKVLRTIVAGNTVFPFK